jgi:hypothetical protein
MTVYDVFFQLILQLINDNKFYLIKANLQPYVFPFQLNAL